MTPSDTSKLIAAAGGDTAFGKLIGIHEVPGFQQRVNNWKRRGLPAAVALQHYDTIRNLLRPAKRAANT